MKIMVRTWNASSLSSNKAVPLLTRDEVMEAHALRPALHFDEQDGIALH
jgi:hypothetical protein